MTSASIRALWREHIGKVPAAPHVGQPGRTRGGDGDPSGDCGERAGGGDVSACRIIHGHVIDGLRSLPAGSVHCCVTSPPYWGLRKYAGATAQVWGGREGCTHDWTETRTERPSQSGGATPKQSTSPGSFAVDHHDRATYTETCRHCGAYRGDLGLEPTWQQFIANIAAVFREVRRVLRDDGTCALNLGDCYSTKPAGNLGPINDDDGAYQRRHDRLRGATDEDPMQQTANGYGIPEKCKLLLPHRVAIALIDDGWIVRQDVVWHKRNPLPESVRDRPTTAHEYVFLLAKRPRYYWDAEAVRSEYADSTLPQRGTAYNGSSGHGWEESGAQSPSDSKRSIIASLERNGGANMRSVLSLAAEPFSAKSVGVSDVDHFAAFPSALVRPFILAGCPERCCPHCGAGWVREVDRGGADMDARYARGEPSRHGVNGAAASSASNVGGFSGTVRTLGFRPCCSCPHDRADCVPGTVLDPFLGSGTTAEVALKHFRHAIGCELSADYVRIAQARIQRAVGMFTEGGVEVTRAETLPLKTAARAGGTETKERDLARQTTTGGR